MAEERATRDGGDAPTLSQAFADAQALLRTAEEEAAQLRVGADRYVRQRESEAELLVGKARRLLAVAEEKAAAIIATARRDAPRLVEASPAIGVDGSEASLGAAASSAGSSVASRPSAPTGLDSILAAAIAKAVDRTFSPEP